MSLVRSVQVEVWTWTGASLKLVSQPLPGVMRLVSSLAIIKSDYMLAGSTRKGLAFLHRKKDVNSFALLATNFALADSTAVDFVAEPQAKTTQLAFLQADTGGNLALFTIDKSNRTVQEAPGLSAKPLGMYHLGHMVCAALPCPALSPCHIPACSVPLELACAACVILCHSQCARCAMLVGCACMSRVPLDRHVWYKHGPYDQLVSLLMARCKAWRTCR